MATALVQTGVQFPGGTIQTSAIDSGIIAMWSGAIDELPTGWFLCDGTNGTPDLRDRFVVNVGPAYAYQATGGSKDTVLINHTHPSPGVTNEIGDHEHSTAHSHNGTSSPAGDHNHTFVIRVQDANEHTHEYAPTYPTVPQRTEPAGAHIHFLSWEDFTGEHVHIPTYSFTVDLGLEPLETTNGGHRHQGPGIDGNPIRSAQLPNSDLFYVMHETSFPIVAQVNPADNPHQHFGYTDFDGSHSHPITTETELAAQYFDPGTPSPNTHYHQFPGSLADAIVQPAGTHAHTGTIRMPDGSIPGVVLGTPLANDPTIPHNHGWTYDSVTPANGTSPVGINPATISDNMQPNGSHNHTNSVILEPPESFPTTYKNMPPFYALAFIMKA